MKNYNFEKAVKRYNDIMDSICREHLTIGTRFSEDTDNWNIRDLVAECDYQLSCYYEGGHCNADMRYGDAEERKAWRRETGRLERFIKAYEPHIKGITVVCNHCSQYDNKPKRPITTPDSTKEFKIEIIKHNDKHTICIDGIVLSKELEQIKEKVGDPARYPVGTILNIMIDR